MLGSLSFTHAKLYEIPKSPTYKSFCFELIFESKDERHLFATTSPESKKEWSTLLLKLIDSAPHNKNVDLLKRSKLDTLQIPSYSSPFPNPTLDKVPGNLTSSPSRRRAVSMTVDPKFNHFHRFATSTQVLDAIEKKPLLLTKKGSIVMNPKDVQKIEGGFNTSVAKELVDSEKLLIFRLVKLKRKKLSKSQSMIVKGGGGMMRPKEPIQTITPSNVITEEVKEKWHLSLERLSVWTDFTRLYSKIKCWNKNFDLMDVNYHQLENQNNFQDSKFLKELLETFSSQLNEMDDWYRIHNNFEQDLILTGDFAKHMRSFLLNNVAESSRIWGLLKALCVSVIAPVYLGVKKQFQDTYGVVIKDDSGSWSVSIVFLEDQIIVVHSKWSKEENNKFSFAYHLQLRFSRSMSDLNDVVLTFNNLKWNEKETQIFRHSSLPTNLIEAKDTSNSKMKIPKFFKSNSNDTNEISPTPLHGDPLEKTDKSYSFQDILKFLNQLSTTSI